MLNFFLLVFAVVIVIITSKNVLFFTEFDSKNAEIISIVFAVLMLLFLCQIVYWYNKYKIFEGKAKLFKHD